LTRVVTDRRTIIRSPHIYMLQVLEIVVKRTPRDQYRATTLTGKLTLVDLAGSERAAETNNLGQVCGRELPSSVLNF
jgi:hypothetical protein